MVLSFSARGMYYTCVMDSGADTCILGKGWEIIAVSLRTARVQGFDEKIAIKSGLPIVNAITALDLTTKTILLKCNQAVHNKDAEHTLLSDFQIREKTHSLDLVAKRHGGKQQFMPNKNEVINLHLKQALMTFDHRKPTKQELEDLEFIEITHDEQ